MNQSILKGAITCALVLSPAAAMATLSVGQSPAADAQADGAQARDSQGVSNASSQDRDEDTKRAALDDYNLGKNGLALEGYDPVAYFPEYEGEATKGSKTITTTYKGVLYRFATEKNKKAFMAAPADFEPTYGGWCAWAMADGKGTKTEPSPKSFTIEDGKLYLFYDGFWGDTKKSWSKKGGAPKLKSAADTNWKRISGEDPTAKPKPAPKPEPAPEKGKGK